MTDKPPPPPKKKKWQQFQSKNQYCHALAVWFPIHGSGCMWFPLNCFFALFESLCIWRAQWKKGVSDDFFLHMLSKWAEFLHVAFDSVEKHYPVFFCANFGFILKKSRMQKTHQRSLHSFIQSEKKRANSWIGSSALVMWLSNRENCRVIADCICLK